MPTQDPGPPLDVLVISRLVLDEITGDTPAVVLGGSGFWAAYGAATVADHVQLASKVGTDLDPFRPQLQRLGVGADALVVDGPTTSRTRITYPRPDERHEEPVPDWAAHVRLRSLLPDVPEPLRRPRAFYVFRDHHPGFWEPMLDQLDGTGSPLMWEVPATVCVPDLSDATCEVLSRTTVLSLNQAEAEAILGPVDPIDAVGALRALGPEVVVLRRGAAGSVVGDADRTVVASAAAVEAIDPTGGGNAYSGAFLAAWIDSRDIVLATRTATAAAASAVERVGPPADRATARRRVAELASTVTVSTTTPGAAR